MGYCIERDRVVVYMDPEAFNNERITLANYNCSARYVRN